MYFVNKGIFVSFHEFITLNIVKLSKKKPVQLNGHRSVKKRIFYKNKRASGTRPYINKQK